jgi:TusA-related sulfurtransferase
VSDLDIIDVTFYGCPMHYIKTREALKALPPLATALVRVNSGNACEELLKSLRKQGYVCTIEAEAAITTTIRVTKND